MAASIGSALREARERHGLSIDTVAFELDLEPRHLRALEEDRLEQELGGVLSSAQAKLYALFLGLDAKALLAGLPPRALHTTSPAAALTAPRAAGSTRGDSGGDEPTGGSTLLKERDPGEPRIVLDDDDTAELLVDPDREGPLSRWTRRARRLRPVGARRQPGTAAPVDQPAEPSTDASSATAPTPPEDAAEWDARWQPASSPREDEDEAGTDAEAEDGPGAAVLTEARVDTDTDTDADAGPDAGPDGDVEAGASPSGIDALIPRQAGATRVDPVTRKPVSVAGVAAADGGDAGARAAALDEGDVDELDDGFADDAYRRRRALAVIGGMLLAAVLLSFTVSSLVGQPDEVQLTDGGTTAEPAAPVEQPADATAGAPDTASAEAAQDEAIDDAADPEGEEAPPEAAAVPPADAADTRVQVLDGVGDRQAYQDAITYLQDLGYQVIRSGGSSRAYTETTLFYTAIGQEQASALAAYDGRFAVVRPNDRGLSEQVELHLVVGADWPLTDGVISPTD